MYFPNFRLAALLLCAVKRMDADGEKIPPDIDVEHHDFAEEIRNGPYKQHRSNQLLNYVVALEHRQKRLLGIHSKVFKLDVIGVHKDYRGQGLGQKLTQLAIDKARAEDCDWVATAATARASQGIFSKMGFKTLYEIPYSLFRENGKVVFQKLHDGGQEGKFMALKLK
ncbi:acetyltransferase, GNAT family [Oesophagostomum dentatum]|uniref:Acetyltransferase, GNAT family n=1 Tax=Oesophagostomum dentatum TaxID=61180 RepID=A0A0B1RWV8_OESDE|nr:acetyltransferase, GNAT family [Oesophagostomum dentatum]